MLKQRIRERILPIAKKRKVPIHTIGVFPSSIPLPSELLLGFDIQADPGFLEDIASETGGVYVHADAIETVLGSFVEPLLSTLGFESAATWQGSVRPRESKTVAEVLIPPGTSQAHVSLVYAGSEMSVSCQGPGGPCPPMAAKARGLVHHVIQHPAPGRWTFRIHGDDVPAEGEPCRFVVSLPRAVSHDWRLTAGRHLHALVVLVAFGVVLGLRELVRRGSRQRGLVAKPGDPG